MYSGFISAVLADLGSMRMDQRLWDSDTETSVGKPWTRRTEREQFEACLSKCPGRKWRRSEEKSSGKGKWITFDGWVRFGFRNQGWKGLEQADRSSCVIINFSNNFCEEKALQQGNRGGM
eukprot:scaffold618202_cov110-Attheya_sp.AAC.1